ncbi:MAG: hypothetical protein QOD40_1538 [Alphaproteobacteria bacterium]|nr:hypothetical protein [Alphaproteobacteria bacterium]
MRPALTLLSKMGRKLVTDLLPAAVASGLVTLLFSQLHNTAPPPNAASTEMARMAHDTREIMLGYTLKEELRKQMAMNAVAVRPVAKPAGTDSVANDRDTPSPRNAKPTVAPTTRAAPVKKTEQQLAIVATKPSSDPEQKIEKRPPGQPLVLSNFATVAPAPAKSDGFFQGKWNDVVSVVKKVPDWAGSATDFVLDLPARALPSWKLAPERNFLKAAL